MLKGLLEKLPGPQWGSYTAEWRSGTEAEDKVIKGGAAPSSGAKRRRLEEGGAGDGDDAATGAAAVPPREQGEWGTAAEGVVKDWYEAKGWTVRGGLMYGCDYTLYRGSPDEYHSEYAVLVADAAAMPSWKDLVGLVRIMEHVKKKLLVCIVDRSATPPALSDFSPSRFSFATDGSDEG